MYTVCMYVWRTYVITLQNSPKTEKNILIPNAL